MAVVSGVLWRRMVPTDSRPAPARSKLVASECRNMCDPVGTPSIPPRSRVRATIPAISEGERNERERGLRAQEHVLIDGLGAGRDNIIQDRVANVLLQRQPVWPPRLALHCQMTGAPVDVVEAQIPDITGTQAKPGEQENDGLVADFHRTTCRTSRNDLLDRCRVDVAG